MPDDTPEETTSTSETSQGSRTFTQDELNRILAEDRRKHAARYGDYDELKAKAAKLDAAEEESKSEMQKLTDRLAQAEARAAEYETAQQRSAWAAEIAQDSAVPAAVLRGATREEMQQHHDTLAELLNVKPPPRRRTATPQAKPVDDDAQPGPGRAAEALRALRRGD